MSNDMHHARPGWDGILDPAEQILWQGRPDSTFRLTFGMVGVSIFALFFTGFAGLWMSAAASVGGFFWMLGLIHYAVGLGLLIATLVGPSFIRRRTWYTLTDRHAFIATDLPIAGRSLKSYPITPHTMIALKEGGLDTVIFANERKKHGNSTRLVEIGFERIADARRVLSLMRGIQKEQE